MNDRKNMAILRYAVILMSLVILGCWDPPKSNVELNEFDQAEYYAMIALTVAQLPNIDNPNIQTTCDICNGTKRSGDGLGPCPCGKNCKCEKSAEVRNKRVIFFVADWCSDCQKMKEETLNDLAMSDWTAGEEPSNHIQIANIARSLNLFKRYNILSIPTMILIKNGKEINRHVGFLKRSKMEDFWEDDDDDDDDDIKRQKCQCDTANTYCNCEPRYGRCSCQPVQSAKNEQN